MMPARLIPFGILLALASLVASAESVTYQGMPVNVTRAEQDAFIAQFEGLGAPKALAMALTESGEWAFGWAGEAAGTLPAIGGALRGCEQARQQKQIDAQCELVRLNDEELEFGRALKQRLELAGDNTPALMWHLRRGRSQVYLGGSMHAFKPSLYPLPPAFEKAYKAADELVLEVDITRISAADMARLQQQYLLLADNKTLDDVLSPALLDQAQAMAAQLGVPWEALNRLTPAGLAMELAQALFMTRGLMPTASFEGYFSQRALADQKPIGELESMAFQLELLSRMPLEVQEADIATSMAESATQLDEMLEAWFAGDAERMAALILREGEKSGKLRAFYHELFEQRNRGMAAKIAAYLEGGKSTRLILVGAGHLAGEGSVISLLADMGYEAEQLKRSGKKR